MRILKHEQFNITIEEEEQVVKVCRPRRYGKREVRRLRMQARQRPLADHVTRNGRSGLVCLAQCRLYVTQSCRHFTAETLVSSWIYIIFKLSHDC